MEWDRRHSAFLYHLLSGGQPVQMRDKLHYELIKQNGQQRTSNHEQQQQQQQTDKVDLRKRRSHLEGEGENGEDENGLSETAAAIIEQQLPPPSQMAQREHQIRKDVQQLVHTISSSPSSPSPSSSAERRHQAKLLFIKLCWEAIAWSNEGWVWVALSPFFLLFSFFFFDASMIAKVKYLYIMLLIDIIVTGSIKYSTKRARPSYNKGGLFVGPDIFSFPSGHSSRAMMLAHVCIFVFGWQHLWSTAVITWAALVAISRLALGRHFLTDVMGGLVLGALEFWATFLVLQRFAMPTFTHE